MSIRRKVKNEMKCRASKRSIRHRAHAYCILRAETGAVADNDSGARNRETEKCREIERKAHRALRRAIWHFHAS